MSVFTYNVWVQAAAGVIDIFRSVKFPGIVGGWVVSGTRPVNVTLGHTVKIPALSALRNPSFPRVADVICEHSLIG